MKIFTLSLRKDSSDNFAKEFEKTQKSIENDLIKAIRLIEKAEKEAEVLADALFADEQNSKASRLTNSFIKAYDAADSAVSLVKGLKLKKKK